MIREVIANVLRVVIGKPLAALTLYLLAVALLLVYSGAARAVSWASEREVWGEAGLPIELQQVAVLLPWFGFMPLTWFLMLVGTLKILTPDEMNPISFEVLAKVYLSLLAFAACFLGLSVFSDYAVGLLPVSQYLAAELLHQILFCATLVPIVSVYGMTPVFMLKLDRSLLQSLDASRRATRGYRLSVMLLLTVPAGIWTLFATVWLYAASDVMEVSVLDAARFDAIFYGITAGWMLLAAIVIVSWSVVLLPKTHSLSPD